MDYEEVDTLFVRRTVEDDIREYGLLHVFYTKCINNQVITFNSINSIDTKLNIIIGILVYLIIKTW